MKTAMASFLLKALLFRFKTKVTSVERARAVHPKSSFHVAARCIFLELFRVVFLRFNGVLRLKTPF